MSQLLPLGRFARALPQLLSLCRPSLGNGPASNSAKYPCHHPCRQIMRHYNRNLTGFSLGEHPPEICWGTFSAVAAAAARKEPDQRLLPWPSQGTLCPVGPVQWNPAKDRLNAALSGSLATNLMHQARGALMAGLQPGTARPGELTAVDRLAARRLPHPPDPGDATDPAGQRLELPLAANWVKRPLQSLLDRCVMPAPGTVGLC